LVRDEFLKGDRDIGRRGFFITAKKALGYCCLLQVTNGYP
jgi:hypothetical protein